MAASGAKSGFGTAITVGGTAITEIIDITGPGQTRSMIDVTNMVSDNAAKEFIGGLLDGGEIKVNANVAAAKVTYLYGLLDDTAGVTTVITLAGSLGAWTQTTWLQAMETKAVLDDKITVEFTLKVTGKPTYA